MLRITNHWKRWLLLTAAVLLTGLVLAGVGHAQEPHVGDVQTLPVISISLKVGSTERETKQVTYTPPPGWYVRSHTVGCTQKAGNSSYTVSTVPRDWVWSSEEKIRERYRGLLELAAKAEDVGLRAELLLEQEQLLKELRKVQSSHHALVVEATARGEGFLRGGASLQLTVAAELVYIGTDASLERLTPRTRPRLVWE
jgi:hypothetical protein